jgi:hypothetical protein
MAAPIPIASTAHTNKILLDLRIVMARPSGRQARSTLTLATLTQTQRADASSGRIAGTRPHVGHI